MEDSVIFVKDTEDSKYTEGGFLNETKPIIRQNA